MSIAPDLTGFVAAQANLRQQLGTAVTFKVPVARTWPGGTKINPDTGEPYDATIKPTSAPFTDIVKRCLVILKQGSPLRPQPDSEVSAAGEMTGMDIILDLAASDHEDVKDASEFVCVGLTYKVAEQKPFQIGGTLYRWLIYGLER